MNKRNSSAIFISLLFILFSTVILVVLLLFFSTDTLQPGSSDLDSDYEDNITVDDIEEKEIEAVNLQDVIDNWVATISGNKSILVYDLDRNEAVGNYNVEELYNTASLYKLFVVYEGYRRVQNGVWAKDEVAGNTGRTILECLDLAIRESNSPCAETLWAMIGHDELDKIVRSDFGIQNSIISKLISNAEDILEIMKIFYNHVDITDLELVARLKDSFLNQPMTSYDWRQGLPSGFSDRVNVYNKVGWAWGDGRWDIYHDAAIIEFPELNRNFIVVIMTNYVSNEKIAELGNMIEQYIISTY